MSFRNILQVSTTAPWSRKAAKREAGRQEEPLLQDDYDETRNLHEHDYGSFSRPGPSSGRSSRRASPETRRRESTLGMVPENHVLQDSPIDMEAEEAEEEVQWDLAERGLYSGSYRSRQYLEDDSHIVFRIIPESCRDVYLRAANITRSLGVPCNLPFIVLENCPGVAFQTYTILPRTNTSNHTVRSTMVIWLPSSRPHICRRLIHPPATSPNVHNSDI